MPGEYRDGEVEDASQDDAEADQRHTQRANVAQMEEITVTVESSSKKRRKKKKKKKHNQPAATAPKPEMMTDAEADEAMLRMFPIMPPAVSDQDASTVQSVIRSVPDLPTTSCRVPGCIVHLLMEHVVFAGKFLIVLLDTVGEFTAERIKAHGAHNPEPDSRSDDGGEGSAHDNDNGGDGDGDGDEEDEAEGEDGGGPAPRAPDIPAPTEKIRVDLRGPTPDVVTDIYARTIGAVHATADATITRYLFFSHSTRNDCISQYLYGTCCKFVRGEREFVSAWKKAVETWVHDEHVATIDDVPSAQYTLPRCVDIILSMYNQKYIQVPLSTKFVSLQASQRDEEPAPGDPGGNPWPIHPDHPINPIPEEASEYPYLSPTEMRALPNQRYGHYWEIPAQSGSRF